MTQNTNAESGLVEELEQPLPLHVFRHVARMIFSTFILTFVLSRVMVILIMTGKVHDFFLHVGTTHVHHLNYGIFILSGVGAYLLFRRPSCGWPLDIASVFYGIGIGLTFDEFGMWVHLGGSYWQGASYDAVVIIGAALGLLAFAPSFGRFKTGHWLWGLFMTAVVLGSIATVAFSLTHWAHEYTPWLQQIETEGPQ